MTILVDDVVFNRHPSQYVLNNHGLEALEKVINKGDGIPDNAPLGIACLLSFVQANWVGPSLDATYPDTRREQCLKYLESDGEPSYSLVRYPWLLVLAIAILSRQTDKQWWYLRAIAIHLQLLENPTLSLAVQLNELVVGAIDEAHDIYGPSVYLEASIYANMCGNQKLSEEFLEKASKFSSFHFSLTGVLGRRTKFQTFDVTQLTVKIDTEDKELYSEPNSPLCPTNVRIQDDNLLDAPVLSENVNLDMPEIGKLILLAHVTHVLKFYAQDTAVRERSSALVEKIVQNPGDWCIYSSALFLRSRLESAKSRYVERAALQLQALVDQIKFHPENDFISRSKYFFATPMPSEWELDKHQARLFAGLGVYRTASIIFERRAMWDEYILCLIQLEEREKAEGIIQEQLERQPVNPKLLCILGDIRNDPSYYDKAWHLSGCKYARAMRSMGMFYIKHNDNELAIRCFERALELNCLFDKIWFLLGCAYMETQEWSKALNAFSRTVALGEDNVVAWNNLAACHLQLGNSEQALIALKEAGKRQYEDWKIWKNIFRVALLLGDFPEAITSFRRVAEIMEKETPLEDLKIILETLRSVILSYGMAYPCVAVSTRQIRVLLDSVMATHFSMNYSFWYLCADYAQIIGQFDEEVEFYFKAYRAMQGLPVENDIEAVKILANCLKKIQSGIKSARCSGSCTTNMIEREQQLRSMVENLYARTSLEFRNSAELTEFQDLL